MDTEIRERTDAYISARHHHPAWQLLAARRAPLVLSCLQTLFEQSQNGIGFDDALQALAEMLAQHANDTEFEINSEDYSAQARKELRNWIKLALVVEREGRLYATDALEEALRFVSALGDRVMTSTASRLSIVQREIENLEMSLNPDPKSRTAHIRRKITELEHELAAVERGDFKVVAGPEANERIREVYTLATGLRADFRRVEDSWREADRQLRQSIVSEQKHRGEIVDKLLDGHDDLLDSAEGRVFHAFHQQLGRSVELDNMKHRLRTILNHPAAQSGLSPQQQIELRWLIMRLVKESAAVIQARARSERDVKGFLKTGLAAEHHRVGALLNEIFQEALNIDWSTQAMRRNPSPLPPIAPANGALPVIERLLFKAVDHDQQRDLELNRQCADLAEVEEDFWSAFDGLDRQALLQQTIELLQKDDVSMSVADLARRLPPTHDLETIALWLSVAREADVPIGAEREAVDVVAKEGTRLRFDIPKVELNAAAVTGMEWEP
jgi:Protein of unknown function (DUF3375)